MKIILNKFDYATIVRNCAKARDGYDGCSKCALSGVCGGPEELEEICSIADESLFEMGYIQRNMPNNEAVSETN